MTFYPLRRAAVLALLIIIVSPLAFDGNDGGSSFSSSPAFFSSFQTVFVTIFRLLTARLVILLSITVHRANRPQLYALVIETAGAANAVLSSQTPVEVERLWRETVRVIENPPTQEQLLY